MTRGLEQNIIMSNDPTNKIPPASKDGDTKPLAPVAERALAEAAARRQADLEATKDTNSVKEVGGRKGPDPVRFGDWENGGIASDF